MSYSSFEELNVWKKSCRLSIRIYKALANTKDYGLRDQMTRASVSIPSNIAEGAERDSTKEFIRFLHISKASAAELRTQLYIASEIKLIEKKLSKELIDEVKIISAMLQKLIVSLKPKT